MLPNSHGPAVLMLLSLITTIAQAFIPYISDSGRTIPCDWNAHCPHGTICALRPEFYSKKSICYRTDNGDERGEENVFSVLQQNSVEPPRGNTPSSMLSFITKNNYEARQDDVIAARKPRVNGPPGGSPNGVGGFNKQRTEQLQALNDFQCPKPDKVSRCQECHNVKDCSQGMVCCPNGRGSSRSCTAPEGSADSFPNVIPLIEGSMKIASQDPIVYDKVGSVTLIKVQRLYILVDSGTIDMKDEIEERLTREGVTPKNVTMLVTTHGHPDHYSNNNLFPHALNMFSGFKVSGSVFVENSLQSADKHHTCVRGLVLMKTPGHTPEDTTLVVESVTGKGTVAIVGDLFLSKEDSGGSDFKSMAWDPKKQVESRRLIGCLADWIVPGHGEMFKVTKEMKREFQC